MKLTRQVTYKPHFFLLFFKDRYRYLFCGVSRIKAYSLTTEVGWFGDNLNNSKHTSVILSSKITEMTAACPCTYVTVYINCKISHRPKFRQNQELRGRDPPINAQNLTWNVVVLITERHSHGHFSHGHEQAYT